MKQKIIILGTGGNALDAYDIVSLQYDVLGFLDDSAEKQQSFSYRGARVLGGLESYRQYPDALLVFAIGSFKNHGQRLDILERLGLDKAMEKFPPVIHPSAIISPSAQIGQGCILLSGTTVGAHASLEPFVWCLQNTIVSHDSILGAATLCACQTTISGNVKVGKQSYLGAGSIIRENITIPEKTLIGAGAVVVGDIDLQGTYIGMPAKPMNRN